MDTRKSKRVLGQSAVHGSSKSKVNLDANSERNAVFYSQEGVVTEYPKTVVYPREGGEIQLEQLRARLPKYHPDDLAGDDMETSNMEMTMAYTTNITILPGFMDRGIQNKENTSAVPRETKGFGTRQPLKDVLMASIPSGHSPPDEKLGRLCEEMGGEVRSGGRRGRVGEEEGEGGEAISELLNDMMLQQSAERQMERQKNNAAGGVAGVRDNKKVSVSQSPPPDLENLVNQENCQPLPSVRPNVSGRGCVTQLNFSDAESSLGTSQLYSLTEDSVGGRGSVLAHSQVRVHEQSGAGGQSFEVFHDSWRNQSQNASYGRPDKLQPAAPRQKSLIERKAGAEACSLAESYQSYDQSQSFQAAVSKSNMSSFSIYEDTAGEQSSFAPFHDSWANSSKDGGVAASSRVGGVGTRGVVELKVSLTESGRERDGGVVYHAALGVPLEGVGGGVKMGGGVNCSLVDQSFTQVGIHHPKIAPSISTPVGRNIDFTFDMSRIQSETEFLPRTNFHHQHTQQQQHGEQQEPLETAGGGGAGGAVGGPQRKRSCILGAMNLSTIREESSSFKSSRSSTTTGTISSSSGSSVSHESLPGPGFPPHEVNINPFSSEIVNMMLNAMSPSVVEEVVFRLPAGSRLPQLSSGRTVMVGHREFTGLKKIASGGFGTIYSCKDQGGDTKVLKVQKPAMQWETVVVSELHIRLKTSGLPVQSFVNAELTFVYNDASVMVLPHYKHGSLLDLANAHGASLYDLCQYYYTAEVLEIVAHLHHCGILHTDLKPDNFMLTDLSGYKNFVSAAGSGLVLIDFGRAVDLTVFPGDALFHGSCNTDGFQCTQMLEGKPWKYEADYFGIAGTVHVLLTGEYMSIQKNPGNGLYHPSKPFSRAQRRGPWSEFFGCLLNTTQPLPLAEMAGEMRTKLKGIQDYVFQAFSKNIFTAVHKKLNQGK